MQSLLDIRLGKCGKDTGVTGFAAAGAIASSGRLIDITRIYINVAKGVYKPPHTGYMSESVLSGTLPVMEACKGYRTVVYMTSRKFAYSSYCLNALAECRGRDADKGTVGIVHIDGDTFAISSGGETRDVCASEAMDIIARELRSPMSCAICDWEGIPLFEDMRNTTRAAMWWYPATLDNPLVSTAGNMSTSYYARAYGSRDGYCIMTGGYHNLRDAPSDVSEYVSMRWDAYNMLLQSQTCVSGECFSCSYLRSCVTRYDHNDKSKSEILLDVRLNI